jgi:hypothetical protein
MVMVTATTTTNPMGIPKILSTVDSDDLRSRFHLAEVHGPSRKPRMDGVGDTDDPAKADRDDETLQYQLPT